MATKHERDHEKCDVRAKFRDKLVYNRGSMKNHPIEYLCARSLSLLAILSAAPACGSSAAKEAEAPATHAQREAESDSSAASAPEKEPPSATAAETTSSAEPKPAEGESAVVEGCMFRAKSFCFGTQEEACASIDCPAAQCMVTEGQPARVKCAE